ncbi:MAG TPA: DUF3536 domain-containing protein [Saprospiraceae bacterium]|nr:DUF3536 domain-containing protein [Saprospiraceae bacterium]HMP23242.1 DUF3536 domain-containing protein [Saprospiraceae bacterium]
MSATNKFICIHGHFYQPPRENAWLEVVERQDSAAPFHDWNERINFECYAPNASARILDNRQYITKIINNYSRISFNFGPTLLSWLELADPETYRGILDADKLSQERFDGHGSAIAQVHSHLILPLANRRDKETQIAWGISDFVHRFGRQPEGMWLAETAVDTETLEILAEQGIQYTILAPRQAKAFRKIGTKEWRDIPSDSVETRRPYLCQLPSGKTIVLFFYHGDVAQGVAFEGLLNNGKNFAHRLLNAATADDSLELVHIATDGESYGHHHRYGEMALADCLNYIEENKLASITNYAYFLAKHPPEYEVQIHENSSWSCVHGVERWRSNCGCNTGGHPGWTQAWRGPLRETLNWLRDQLIPIYEREAAKYVKDVWAARNDYIQVLLKRTDRSVNEFIRDHALKELDNGEKTTLMRLMEMQRNAILMFTSCGWFFDEISGIETNQILQYANRAIYYANQVGNLKLHDDFIQKLAEAPSNVYKNGAESYKRYVMPARVDLSRVAMHYAASSLFAETPEELELFNYLAISEVFDRHEAGIQRLALGRTTVNSKITYSEKHFSFAVLYLGQLNIIGNISLDMSREIFDEMKEKIVAAFQSTNLGAVIGVMQTYFGSEKFTVEHLFRDEKRKILRDITNNSLRKVEREFREIYNENYQLMSLIAQSDIPVPEAYLSALQFVVNHDLHEFFANGNLNIRELKRLASELKRWDISLTNEQSFKLTASERIFLEMKRIEAGKTSLRDVENFIQVLETIESMSIGLDIWKSQNVFFSLMKGYKKGEWVFAGKDWEEAFQKLGDLLRVRSN